MLEDTDELHLVHENAVGLIAARGELSEAQITAGGLGCSGAAYAA